MIAIYNENTHSTLAIKLLVSNSIRVHSCCNNNRGNCYPYSNKNLKKVKKWHFSSGEN